MPRLDDVYPDLRAALEGRYGPGASPPASGDPFEAVLRAWLARTADTHKAASALVALRDAGLLDPDAWREVEPAEVVDALRGGGLTLATKAVGPLIRLARWAAGRGPFDLRDAPTAALREELVALRGIGPATADGLLLDALDRPVYPVDRPSYRVFARHGWIDPSADYEEARGAFERGAPDDPSGLRRLAHGLQKVAAEFCRVGQPRCERCPLRPYLPPTGPVEGDGG